MPLSDNIIITIQTGARSSPLSKIQVKEIYEALIEFHSTVQFDVHYFSTTGDKDQKTSLRSLGSTDFFTKEIDEWVLEKKGRVGIHSAKDLPSPLPKGLSIFCLTQGLDPADVLVLPKNQTLEALPRGARIATSSVRREECALQLRPDLTFMDLRGTIEQRLAKLENSEADGVIVAEAALIRLGLQHLNRIRLPGETAEGQGRLAVVGQSSDEEMKQLFFKLDCVKNVGLFTCISHFE